MKHIFFVIFILSVCVLMTSCYAFLQADKLVYAGTLAKKPSKTIIINDSIVQTVE